MNIIDAILTIILLFIVVFIPCLFLVLMAVFLADMLGLSGITWFLFMIFFFATFHYIIIRKKGSK